MPFEMLTVKAMPDGFEIEFTQPVKYKIETALQCEAANATLSAGSVVLGSC